MRKKLTVFTMLVTLFISVAFACHVLANNGFVIHKIDDNGNPVEGAVFSVYGKPKVSFTTNPEENPAICEHDPPVEKKLVGDDPTEAYEFSFTMRPVDPSYPMVPGSVDGVKTVTITEPGPVEFGTITFTKEGTYDYTISEDNLEQQGFDYDENVYKVRYVVENKDGKLEATRTFYKNDEVIEGLETITFENTFTANTRNIEVTKIWEDSDNQDGIRPSSITVKLLADGTEVDSVELNDSNNWNYQFKNFPEYDNGTEIVYTISEVSVEGYTSATTGDMNNGFTITNTHITEKTQVNVEKVWVDDNNNDGIRPSSVTVKLLADGTEVNSAELKESDDWKYQFVDLPKYKNGNEISYTVKEDPVEGYTSEVTGDINNGFTITNTHTLEKRNVVVEKKWEDSDNQDGIRPASITIKLLANGTEVNSAELKDTNNWKHQFVDLPKYQNGREVSYTISEVYVDGYTSAVTGNMINGYTITNTHVTEKTQVNVRKVWDDDNNNDGIRPSSVTVKLLADGTDTGKTLILNEQNAWKATFNDLDKNKNGVAIAYTVEEVKTAVITGTDGPGTYKDTVSGSVTDGFVIINEHTPIKASLTATKTWDDNNNQDGLRGESHLQLFKKVGSTGQWTFENKYATVGQTYTQPRSEVKTWDDLYVYEEGQPVYYSVTETTILVSDPDWITNYTVTYDSGEGTEYKNESERVGVNLVDGNKSIDVKNTHTPETITISGTKNWPSEPMLGWTMPDNITVKLQKKDGTNWIDVETKTVTKDNTTGKWTYSFENQPKYNAGIEIEYRVVEEPVAGYKASGGTKADNYNITNEYDSRTLTLTKTWVGDASTGMRPDELMYSSYLQLYQNDELMSGLDAPTPQVVNNNDNTYTITYTVPRVDAQGNEIEYKIEEVDVPNYIEGEITGNMENGYAITNTAETLTISGSKEWKNSDGTDGDINVDNFVVKLQNSTDGTTWSDVESKTVVARTTDTSVTPNAWTFNNLPKYKDGVELQYRFVEDPVPEGWISSGGTKADGYKITNTYNSGVTVNVHFATEAEGETWIVGTEQKTIEQPITVYNFNVGYEVYKYAYTYTVGGVERTDCYYGNNEYPYWTDNWWDENFNPVQDNELIDNLKNNAVLQKQEVQKILPKGIFKEGTKKTITVEGPNGYSKTHTVNIGEDFTFTIPIEADSGTYTITQVLLTESDVDTDFVNAYGTGVTGVHQVSVTAVGIDKNGDNYDITIIGSDTLFKTDDISGYSGEFSNPFLETLDEYYGWSYGGFASVKIQGNVIDIKHYLSGFRVQ